MFKDKRDRREKFMGSLSKQRFEQEVAGEIGISLKVDKTGSPNRRAGTDASAPGAQGTGSKPPGWDKEKSGPEWEKKNKEKGQDKP